LDQEEEERKSSYFSSPPSPPPPPSPAIQDGETIIKNYLCDRIRPSNIGSLDWHTPFAKTPYLGLTPLHLAIIKDRYNDAMQMLKLTLAPTTINHQDGRGFTALTRAIRRGNLELVVTLLHYGANPNLASFDGMSPLHWAMTSDDSPIRVQIANVLLKAGADKDAQEREELRTPLDICAIRHNTNLYKQLLEYKAKRSYEMELK
jgi:ankyrin repeat protein